MGRFSVTRFISLGTYLDIPHAYAALFPSIHPKGSCTIMVHFFLSALVHVTAATDPEIGVVSLVSFFLSSFSKLREGHY